MSGNREDGEIADAKVRMPASGESDLNFKCGTLPVLVT
jgi:hypothetical protein